MISWLTENLATIIISLVVLALVVIIIVSMHRNGKKGKTSCGCNCASCPMNGSCKGH